MKKLTIVAEMPDAAGNALAYGDGALTNWAADALTVMLEADCNDSNMTWGKDVERLFGFRAEDAVDAFRVTEARIEDARGPELEAMRVELDEETVATLEALARDAGMTPEAYLNGPIKDALLEEARKAADGALP